MSWLPSRIFAWEQTARTKKKEEEEDAGNDSDDDDDDDYDDDDDGEDYNDSKCASVFIALAYAASTVTMIDDH